MSDQKTDMGNTLTIIVRSVEQKIHVLNDTFYISFFRNCMINSACLSRETGMYAVIVVTELS